jgi:phosphoglycerate dehydrogenase-like enzyme
VLDDYQAVAEGLAAWHTSRHRLDVTFFHDHVQDGDALVHRLQEFDVVVVMRERTPLTAQTLSELPQLKLIVTTGMHNPSIAPGFEKLICGTGGWGSPTSELTWALILGLTRNLRSEEQSLRAGNWQTSIGSSLDGATLGILGLGKVGSSVARLGQAFGMNVVAWSQNLTPEAAEAHGVHHVSAETLFTESDVVSVHLRLGPRTENLVDESRLRSMKSTSLLINTARAGIVNQDALVMALEQGWIGGAGIDVYEEEPLVLSHPLLQAPRTLLTPHVGYVTRQNYEMYFNDALESIEAWLDGTPIRVLSAPRPAESLRESYE